MNIPSMVVNYYNTTIMLFLVLVTAYIYLAITLQTIAKKTKTKNSWLAWIPFANLWLMKDIADAPTWSFITIIIGIFLPYIGPLIVMIISTWYLWNIAEKRNMPGWIALLALIPFINLVIYGILAWKN